MKTPDANPDTPDDAWDALFRQRLNDYTDTPPADALTRILGAANPPRPPVYGRWLPLSLAALLLIGVGGWLFVRKANRVLQPVAVTEQRIKRTPQLQRPTTEVQLAGGQTTANEPLAGNRKPLTASNEVVRSTPKPVSPKGSEQTGWFEPAARRPLAVADEENHVSKLRGRKGRPIETPASVDKAHSISHYTAGEDRQFSATDPQTVVNGLPPTSRSSRTAPRHEHHNPELGIGPLVSTDRQNKLGNASTGDYTVGVQAGAVPIENRMAPIAALPGRLFRPLPLTATLPPVLALAMPVATPQASRAGQHPAWFVSLTPLYNYQQIDPIHTDAELVSDIRVARPLAGDRLGVRLQAGTEWQLTHRLRLRTSLLYQQVRQSLRYAVQSTQPDSVQVVVTNQSVQVTPVFTRRSYAETATWHYAGLSTDLVWQLNRQTNRPWQHYLTVGATLGRFMSRGGAVNGFVQAGYGIERPLTTGLRLRVEPTVQLGWQALTDATQRLQSRPYGYGLALGLRFR